MKGSIQCLQDIKLPKTLKSFLARFSDEMTYCVQVISRDVLYVLRGELNTNTLFWMDVQNREPTSYYALLEMMMHEIINKELINHQSRTSMGLLPTQRQHGKGPISYLMDHQ